MSKTNRIAFAERKTVGIEDMVLLSSKNLSQEGVIDNLEKRFKANEIYTYIGSVLVVCNPFKWLPLYDAAHVKQYNGANMKDSPPHIFAIADNAFRQMIEEEEKQCCIISGESGAGKTEAAKQIMAFIAAASGTGGNDRAVTKVKDIILDSNPALEAFGNAMTVRNNNSSRFGKYFEIKFEAGTPRGGTINNYLLEKSRVVRPGREERSFHIFYQLLCGGDRTTLQDFGLSGDPGDYSLLAQTGTLEINNEGGRKDDAKEFTETLSSLETVGVFQKEQMDFFSIVAAVLHLSNIQFYSTVVEGADGSGIQDPSALEAAAGVLQVAPNDLQYAICYRTLTTMAPGGKVETYLVPNNPPQAMAAKEALQKEIYERMFSMLVRKINVALETGGNNTRMSMRRMARNIGDSGLSIGVLDIFGFEIFDDNRFEQFCINFVNEKLQQIFIELTIKSEQEDYENEGIQWQPIPYFDNKTVCDLVEAKRPPGVFAVLDDVTKTMNAKSGTEVDKKFLNDLKGVVGGHAHFNAFNGGFKILHYAGEVDYNVAGFVSSNKNAVTQDMQHMVKNSSSRFLQSLFPEEIDIDQRRAPPSTSYKLKNSAADLVDTLMDCAPHYVRCIKSNEQKRAGMFDAQRVSHQAQYLALLENIKVRRAGFAYRVFFDRFIGRFKVLAKGEIDPRILTHGSDYDIAKAILEVASRKVESLQQPGEAQLGKLKLFIKQPETFFELQEARKEMLNDIVAKIQRTWRRFNLRKDLVNLRQEMADLFEERGKDATPTDLLRPYYGAYIEEKELTAAIGELLDFHRAGEIKQESIHYSDKVKRLVGKKFEEFVLIITDQAMYIADWIYNATPKEVAAEQKRLANERKLPPHMRNQGKDKGKKLEKILYLKRRTDLKNIKAVWLSQEADDHLMVEVIPDTKKKPDKSTWVDKKKVKRCMESQEAFSFFGKSRHRCHYTGNIYVQDFTRTKIPLPDLGYYSPVEVHHSIVGKVSVEPRQDIVLVSEKKAEIAAELRNLVTRIKGGGIQPKAAFTLNNLRKASVYKPQAKALYDYSAQQPDELSLRKGDVIDLIDTDNEDWWTGTVGGKTGTFPAVYVEKMLQTPIKPKMANPNNYLIGINFANEWAAGTGVQVFFNRDETARELTYKNKGSKVYVSVPVGVIGQKLREIQASQARREAKREAERQELYRLRQANAERREEERRRAREQRLEQKKMKRKQDKAAKERGKQKANIAFNLAKSGGASFASRMTNGGGQEKVVPSWQRGTNNGSNASGNSRGFTTVAEPRGWKPSAPKAQKQEAASPWKAYKDDSTGDVYYYNTVTQVSQWVKPPGFNGRVES